MTAWWQCNAVCPHALALEHNGTVVYCLISLAINVRPMATPPGWRLQRTEQVSMLVHAVCYVGIVLAPVRAMLAEQAGGGGPVTMCGLWLGSWASRPVLSHLSRPHALSSLPSRGQWSGGQFL